MDFLFAPWEGKEVSIVATKTPDSAAAPVATDQQWTRTAEQQDLVEKHLQDVVEQYINMGADPALVEILLDERIVGTTEIEAELEYKRKTRVFQLYSNAAQLAEDDQVPHPGAIPEPDAALGKRGARDIRGIMYGRFVEWTLQSGRKRWDSIQRKVVPQTGINHGGAPRRA